MRPNLIELVLLVALGLPLARGALAAGPTRPSSRRARTAKHLVAKPPTLKKSERHLLFDECSVEVRGGHGGHGAVVSLPRRGEGPRLKRTAEADYVLPPGGGDGGDVLLFVDPACSDLLHLRERQTLAAARGGDACGLSDLPAARARFTALADEPGAPAGLAQVRLRMGADLRVAVPPGTFVRTKAGRVLADLVRPGDELRVAAGGPGGPTLLDDTPPRRAEAAAAAAAAQDEAVALAGPRGEQLRALTRGGPPEEVALELVLRTVADVGFVGFPNAGKSSLLAALSRASPAIAPFPFTTMVPNLGAMLPAGSKPGGEDEGAAGGADGAVLADLPGLVEGAHRGKGLGRLFLRHLRRVRVLLYVLDTDVSAPAVGEQYDALRRELALYNPAYLARPHLVALSKLDLPLRRGGEPELERARREAAVAVRESARAAEARGETAPPVAVVPVSALRGKGLRALKRAIAAALARSEAEAT